ncbi:hypothetical protein [Bradyrhizobium sp. Gha]|uniref:hypothetical protein n=1 Tax=Bradyrhizobium sp. Gha TaxID=1855318 RepID=UPI0015A6EFA4|nr:hypothetical protein [Bradyrhizobium sp. Gha]
MAPSLEQAGKKTIQKFMDQNTQLFVATGAAVALKNHWNDKALDIGSADQLL